MGCVKCGVCVGCGVCGVCEVWCVCGVILSFNRVETLSFFKRATILVLKLDNLNQVANEHSALSTK